MTALVSLATVKTGLRIDSSDNDDLLAILIEAASDAVTAYLKDQAAVVIDFDRLADSPSDYDVPQRVQWATVLQVQLYFDGDNGAVTSEPGNLCRAAQDLLYPLRDPALA